MLNFLLGILFWQIIGTIFYLRRRDFEETLVIACFIPFLIIKVINTIFRFEKRFIYRRIILDDSKSNKKVFISDYNYNKNEYEIMDLIEDSKIRIDGVYYTRKNFRNEEFKSKIIIRKISELNLE